MTAFDSVVAVLDNEPIQALADPHHSKHRDIVRVLEAIAQRRSRRASPAAIVMSTVVRVEAGVTRQASGAAALGRLRVRDEPLTSERADRAVTLAACAGGAPADAVTAQLAEEFAVGARVTIYTADLTDLPRLVGAMTASGVRVQQI